MLLTSKKTKLYPKLESSPNCDQISSSRKISVTFFSVQTQPNWQVTWPAVLRGDAGEEAVLCTSDKTYSVRECTTSNSLLLTPDLSTDTASVSDVINTRRVTSTNFVYYEVNLRKCTSFWSKIPIFKRNFMLKVCWSKPIIIRIYQVWNWTFYCIANINFFYSWNCAELNSTRWERF